ncbi:MAG: hypothetical protein ACPG5B_10645 [Chitinophagales bacterium]
MNKLNLFVTTNLAIVLIIALVTLNITITVILFLLVVASFIAFRNYIREANDEMLRQFSTLNKQLKLRLSISTPTFFKIGWEYPSLSGQYLGRVFSLSARGSTIFTPKPSNISVSLDVSNYGKTFEIKPQTWRKNFYNKTGHTLNRIFGERISTFMSKWFSIFSPYSGIHSDQNFNDLYIVSTNDSRFMNQVLDKMIVSVFTQDLWPDIGVIKLDNGIMTYSHQALIDTDMERYHLEKVILVMYMLAKHIEYKRQGKA